VEGIWRAMAADISFAPIPRCGHLPHEERPDLVNQSLLDFLQPWKAPGG
jgi:haloacetate dehalogenase